MKALSRTFNRTRTTNLWRCCRFRRRWKTRSPKRRVRPMPPVLPQPARRRKCWRRRRRSDSGPRWFRQTPGWCSSPTRTGCRRATNVKNKCCSSQTQVIEIRIRSNRFLLRHHQEARFIYVLGSLKFINARNLSDSNPVHRNMRSLLCHWRHHH